MQKPTEVACQQDLGATVGEQYRQDETPSTGPEMYRYHPLYDETDKERLRAVSKPETCHSSSAAVDSNYTTR